MVFLYQSAEGHLQAVAVRSDKLQRPQFQVSVVIGQKLQDRSKKRQDKMEIFKELMTSRVYGWTNSSVQALNIIDVVFAEVHSDIVAAAI